MDDERGTFVLFEKIPELACAHLRTRDKEECCRKLIQLISGGRGCLQVITDFDRTLTKYHVNGEPTKSSYCIFESCPSVPKTYIEKAALLVRKYHPIEEDPHMSKKEKLPFMEKWWLENSEIMNGIQLAPNDIEKAVKKARVEFRDGTDTAFKQLSESKVPVLVFSAGIGDVVSAVLRLENLYHSNVHVISNFLKYDGAAINGFQGAMIHIYNKNEHVVKHAEYFKDLVHRKNVILMGDSLGDASMAEGMPIQGVVLKIGFLNSRIDEYLDQYLDHFDIVLLDDQTMDVFNAILRLVL